MAAPTWRSLCTASPAELEQVLAAGKGPSIDSIAGFEFRGWNVLAPHERFVMGLMGNLRFIKCFFRAKDGSGEVHGYNLKVRNGTLDEPWATVPDEAKPARQGRYKVYATRNRPGTNVYPSAAFLDYAQPENNLFTGSTIDDYVVQPDPANPDLLLGKAFTHLGVLTPATYFVLERLQPHAR